MLTKLHKYSIPSGWHNVKRQIKHEINRVASWVYFKTMNEFTLQQSAANFRNVLADKGIVCRMCKIERPLNKEWQGSYSNLYRRCYMRIGTMILKQELKGKGVKFDSYLDELSPKEEGR